MQRRLVLLVVALAAIAAIGLGGALTLSLRLVGNNLEYQVEWVHALLEVGLIGVSGAAASAVLEHLKDGLQQRRDDSRLRFDMLTGLDDDYNAVKLVRRKLQKGAVFGDDDWVLLNQVQLRVEKYRKNCISLFEDSDELEKYLHDVESYLNKLVNNTTPERMNDFVSKEGFGTFAVDYHSAAGLIRREIAGRRLKHSNSKHDDAVRPASHAAHDAKGS
jgi:hypothetical protein